MKVILIVFFFNFVISCGGGGSGADEKEFTAETNEGISISVEGRWIADVVITRDTCNIGEPADQGRFRWDVKQSGGVVTVDDFWFGETTSDGFQAIATDDPITCVDGSEALPISRLTLGDVRGNEGYLVLNTELGCPELFCGFTTEGSAFRVDLFPQSDIDTESTSNLSSENLQTNVTSTGVGVDSTNVGCCKVCRTGKPCGDTCIAIGNKCMTPPGCACSG